MKRFIPFIKKPITDTFFKPFCFVPTHSQIELNGNFCNPITQLLNQTNYKETDRISNCIDLVFIEFQHRENPKDIVVVHYQEDELLGSKTGIMACQETVKSIIRHVGEVNLLRVIEDERTPGKTC